MCNEPREERHLALRVASALLARLDPRFRLGRPLLFVVEVGALLATVLAVRAGVAHLEPLGPAIAIAGALLLLTLLVDAAELLVDERLRRSFPPPDAAEHTRPPGEPLATAAWTLPPRTPFEVDADLLLVPLAMCFFFAVMALFRDGPSVPSGGALAIVGLVVALLPVSAASAVPVFGAFARARLCREGVLPLAPDAVDALASVDCVVLRAGDGPATDESEVERVVLEDDADDEQIAARLRALVAEGRRVAIAGHGETDAALLDEADFFLATSPYAQDASALAVAPAVRLSALVSAGRTVARWRGLLLAVALATDVARFVAMVPLVFAASYPALRPFATGPSVSPAGGALAAILSSGLLLLGTLALAGRVHAAARRPSLAVAVVAVLVSAVLSFALSSVLGRGFSSLHIG